MLSSVKTQIPFSYNYLDLCEDENPYRPNETFTELLSGTRSQYSNYIFEMNFNATCLSACMKEFSEDDIEIYKWLIDRNYYVTYYLDKLPSGYSMKLKKKIFLNKTEYTNYFSGIPIGYKKGSDYFIYNHLVFYVKINKKDNKYQVVDFYASAHSVNQKSDKKCINYEKGEGSDKIADDEEEDNKNEDKSAIIQPTIEKINMSIISEKFKDRIYNVLEDGTKRYYKYADLQPLNTGSIGFTYDVIFINSNISFSSRYDHYFSLKGTYRWIQLISSYFLILIFTAGVFVILSRTVKKDLEIYNSGDIINDNIPIDEHGWKQICGDVFRAPKHLKTLSAFIGTGIELLCIIIISLILSLIGFVKPEIRSKTVNYIFICCISFGIIAGYVSTFIYKNNGGKQWLINSILTALFFPAVSLSVLFIIRIIMSFEYSSASFKLSQMALLSFLWLFISSPLIFAGTLLCLIRKNVKIPCKVNPLPTTIGKKPWYLHLYYVSCITGIIPFVTLFIEFVYLLKSLWTYQVYYLASFLSLSLIFSIIISSEMSIIYVFVNLCYGDHKWWWKSFFVSASPAIYIVFYSFVYFLKLGLTRLSAIVVYFLIMGLIALGVALVLGSAGTLLTFWFVHYIYSKIKID